MVNINLLKSEWVKRGLVQKDVADILGITTRTLSAKLKKRVFGSDEIEKLIKSLDIKDPIRIFFDD